jgi:AraC-like DNA-binding protein
MSTIPPESRAVLEPAAAAKRFSLARHPAAEDVGFFVAWYWIVRWDLAGEERFTQETLPYPCVNFVFERGASVAFGVISGRGSRELHGAGAVIGVKLHPGAFRPFWSRPVSELTDRAVPLETILGPECKAVEADVANHDDDAVMVSRVEAFLRTRLPARDAQVAQVKRIVETAEADRELRKVDDLVARVGVGKRTLQRLFSEYVGVSPKWVIQRYRLQEAAEHLAEGKDLDLARLALDLGYFDQPHFINDFRKMIGRSPGDYARH